MVVGAEGAIGSALLAQLQARPEFAMVRGFSRNGLPASAGSAVGSVDVCSESSIADATRVALATQLPLRLFINATGFLHGEGHMPEKSWRQIDPGHMAKAFAVNTIGPALLLKHFMPLLAREGKAVFAMMSAGSSRRSPADSAGPFAGRRQRGLSGLQRQVPAVVVRRFRDQSSRKNGDPTA